MAAVTDDFNRADGTGLGANWTYLTAGGDFKILSNQAEPTGFGAVAQCVYTGTAFGADQYAQAKMAVNPYQWGVMARTKDQSAGGTAGQGYQVRGGDSISLDIKILVTIAGGSATVLQSTAVTADVGDTLRIEVQGSTVRAYKNGVQVGSDQSDATYASGGGPGIEGGYAGFDGFDDFAGGDLGGAPASSILRQMMQHHG
jgi:hypothetical protein